MPLEDAYSPAAPVLAYLRHIDAGDMDAVEECFTSDALYVVRREPETASAQLAMLEGRQAIGHHLHRRGLQAFRHKPLAQYVGGDGGVVIGAATPPGQSPRMFVSVFRVDKESAKISSYAALSAVLPEEVIARLIG